MNAASELRQRIDAFVDKALDLLLLGRPADARLEDDKGARNFTADFVRNPDNRGVSDGGVKEEKAFEFRGGDLRGRTGKKVNEGERQ